MGSMVVFPTKYVNSIVPLRVDFTSQLADGESMDDCTCSISVVSGADEDPDAMLINPPPDFELNVAEQLVGGGVAGVMYRINFNCTTTDDNELIISGYLAVIDTNPWQE